MPSLSAGLKETLVLSAAVLAAAAGVTSKPDAARGQEPAGLQTAQAGKVSPPPRIKGPTVPTKTIQPQVITDEQWAKVELAGKNTIPKEICDAIAHAFLVSLHRPEAKGVSAETKLAMINFIEKIPNSGNLDCGGQRILPWVSNDGKDVIFLDAAIHVANKAASAVATVNASKKAGRPVRVDIHIPTAYGVAPARYPLAPSVGSLKSGPSG